MHANVSQSSGGVHVNVIQLRGGMHGNVGHSNKGEYKVKKTSKLNVILQGLKKSERILKNNLSDTRWNI